MPAKSRTNDTQGLRVGMMFRNRLSGGYVSRSVKLLLMLLVIAVLGGTAWYVWLPGDGAGATTTQNAQQTSGENRAKPSQQPVPVTIATAQAESVPILLRGIGTVQAFNSVTVKSRVDGNIVKVGFTEGQLVHTGDLLFQVDPRPYQAVLQQANANLAKDEANLQNAQLELTRYENLLNKGAGTEEAYTTQRATVAQIQAQVANDQAQIDAAKINLDFASITSPIDALAGIRQVDLGNFISGGAGTPLVLLTQIQPIYVVFSLPERGISQVRQAMAQRKLTVFALDGKDKRQIAEGEVTLINNTVDAGTGTVQLKAQFSNRDGALWPGQFVNAHVVLETVENGITVPAAAVQAGPNGPFAYVVRPDSTVELRPLRVRQVENNTSLIDSGLRAGEKVVTAGQFALTPGMRVTVKDGPPPPVQAAQSKPAPSVTGSTPR
jgi:membrane fusion protein, multidrug efflux system